MMPDEVRNGKLDIMCDNAGFVFSYEAKYSKCAYVYTVAKAIHDAGFGLACKVQVMKTLRCSTAQEYNGTVQCTLAQQFI